MDELLRELSLLVRARYPIIYLVTWEERRVDKALRSLASQLQKRVHFWRVSRGFDALEDGDSPANALNQAVRSRERAFFVLQDFHPYLEDPLHVRLLRDAAHALKTSYKTLFLVSPVLKIPPELEKEITVIDVPLPGREDLSRLLQEMVQPLARSRSITVEEDCALEERVVQAALGLTESEAANVFAKVLVEDRAFTLEDVSRIVEEKRQIIRKAGLLEYCQVSERMDDVGGLDLLKEWLRTRAGAFSEKAREFGLPEPKGLLLLGVQGCGKSLTAKAIASAWRLPMLRLDVGAIMNAYVGSSEENMRKAIRIAESLAPCILWLDEIEKGFESATGGGPSGDSGTSARVFATFLTWLQEKTEPVFVIATANSIERLPPEMLRKGRFDEIFFVDLPSEREREAIFRIHLRRRGRDPGDYDVEELAKASAGMSGAEIEAVTVEALWRAFPQDRELTQFDLQDALVDTVPLSRTMAESIDSLRTWARSRARPASGNHGA
jgi:ATP-dependent 26S proteasome regulatory subunit